MQALSGLSGLSGVVSAAGPPAAPAGLTVTPNGSDGTQMSVSWTASGGALTYDLQRSTDNSTWTTVSAAQAGTTFGDTGLSYNTLYYYRVRANNASGSSAYGASVSATTVYYNPAIDPNLLAAWMADKGVYHDAGTTLATNGQTVAQWNDQGPGANNLAAFNGPVWNTGVINGLPAIAWSGGNQYAATAASLFSGANPRTIFCVYAPANATDVMPVAGEFGTQSTGDWFSLYARTPGAIGDPYLGGYAADLTGPAMTTAWKIGAVSYDGTTAYLYRNSVLKNSGAKSYTTAASPLVIANDTLGDWFTGNIAEVLVYDVECGSNANIWAYLNAKSGIALT